MGDHLTRCERCGAIVATGWEYGDHMDYHRRQDKKEAVNREAGSVKGILRAVVDGIFSDDVWMNGWCPVCHEHPDSHAAECALVEAAEVLKIDLDAT